MFLRSLLIFLGIFSLTACATDDGLTEEEFWEITAGCGGQKLCTYANVITAAFSTLISEPDPDGFEVIGVTTDGKTVTIEATVPDADFEEYISQPLTNSENFRLAGHFDGCKTETIREFLELGGALKVIVYNSAGEKAEEEVSRPC